MDGASHALCDDARRLPQFQLLRNYSVDATFIACVFPERRPGPAAHCALQGRSGGVFLCNTVLSGLDAMALFTVKPTKADQTIARAVARHTAPVPEKAAELLSWGADEHILLALAASFWLYARGADARARTASNHLLLTTAAVTLLPHVLKRIFDQERPDRATIRGHLNGVPFSGKALDAFPSGHALHVGALASAATELPPAERNVAWGVGGILVLTRVVLLAHWASDVVAGLAIGAAVERLLRYWTGYGTGDNDSHHASSV
jgi:undecaprenyl-diphosphatase